MVKLREVTIIKDSSLLNEKLGPFKIRKLLPLALGGMLGYGMIRKGTIDDIAIGIIVIIASLIIAFGPDRALSFENQLQAMLYYYTLKSKGMRIVPTTTQIQNTEELEIKISSLRQQIKDEKDLVKKLMLKTDLLQYEIEYYSAEISNIDSKIQELRTKMKSANKIERKKISEKIKKLYKKRSELNKLKNKNNAELRKFEKVQLISNEELNELKKKIDELRNQIKTTTDKKKLKELKEQYHSVLLEYYNKKITQDKALIKLINDKALKSRISAELKEIYKKKAELEKKIGRKRFSVVRK
ncbi:hypothetical protein GFS03_08285 [Sulfolobus sp. E5-1-F]|uniref:coiled-coil domain-containing protein n=1 Tax=Saccharolobus sp. E5-1-F TaxID=2663019 RepID=UPI0012957E3C|nr:hypothetical protein [Sulfolobus sp. E5-1-F]QGA54566.1 hypothetical protein GFS03_08285 [Sulfolobus sp. E5-1-F]